MSIDRSPTSVGDSGGVDLPDSRATSAACLRLAEAQASLREQIQALPDEERVAIRLRFERGMKAREIAQVLGIRNYKRVYEIQGRGLEKLARQLQDKGFSLRDFIAVDGFESGVFE